MLIVGQSSSISKTFFQNTCSPNQHNTYFGKVVYLHDTNRSHNKRGNSKLLSPSEIPSTAPNADSTQGIPTGKLVLPVIASPRQRHSPSGFGCWCWWLTWMHPVCCGGAVVRLRGRCFRNFQWPAKVGEWFFSNFNVGICSFFFFFVFGKRIPKNGRMEIMYFWVVCVLGKLSVKRYDNGCGSGGRELYFIDDRQFCRQSKTYLFWGCRTWITYKKMRFLMHFDYS